MQKRRNIKSIINAVAKTPTRQSYLWEERSSLLALVSFWLVTLLRSMSLLQWIKFLTRSSQKKPSEGERYQKRINFHAANTEMYFLVVALCMTCVAYFYRYSYAQAGDSIKIVSAYFALESIIWVCYYLFFRHFSERNFTIYHNSEYFLGLPIALYIQVVGIALVAPSCSGDIVSRSVDVLDMIFNLNFDKPGVCDREAVWLTRSLPLLGLFYVVILLSNLRDAFPKTVIKPGVFIGIIGAGDVVVDRILPSLLCPAKDIPLKKDPVIDTHPKTITIYDLSGNSEVTFIKREIEGRKFSIEVKGEESSHKIITEIVAERTPTIIASTSDSHFYYLGLLAANNIRFAVEKPATIYGPEIDMLVSSEGDALFRDGFAMSYYALEKALPLTYLFQMHPVHRDYLEIELERGQQGVEKGVATLPWNAVMGNAALPTRISIFLLEGTSRSPSAARSNRLWTEDPHIGGLLFETAIHAITILEKILRDPEDFSGFSPSAVQMVSELATNKSSASFLRLTAKTINKKPIDIDIMVGKYIPDDLVCRGALIEYEGSEIVCDFDSMELLAKPVGSSAFALSEISRLKLRVKEQYCDTILIDGKNKKRKYSVQTALVKRFFEAGWSGARFDDFKTQRRVLAWLGRYKARLLAESQDMPLYTENGANLPADLKPLIERFHSRQT
ncbi:MAG: hypothetical protein V4505_19880 [Pseudomonadota bacterium]